MKKITSTCSMIDTVVHYRTYVCMVWYHVSKEYRIRIHRTENTVDTVVHLSILRRRCNSSVSYPEGECFAGYALEMKTIIRTENVNLLTGVFDLSYTSFADYIHGPKYGGKLIGKRDYRSATYEELKAYRVAWYAYQARQQDQRRANEQRRARAAESKGKAPPLNRNKAPVPILILVVRRHQHKNKEPHRQRGT